MNVHTHTGKELNYVKACFKKPVQQKKNMESVMWNKEVNRNHNYHSKSYKTTQNWLSDYTDIQNKI